MLLICSWLGFALNIVGTAIAAGALYGEARHHIQGDVFPMVGKVRRWVDHRILGRRTTTPVTSTRDTSWIVDVAEVIRRSTAPPGATVDEQLDSLRREVEFLHDRIADQRTITDDKVAVVTARLEAHRTNTFSELANIRETVHDMATGSFKPQLLGLVLVGIGSFVAILPVIFRWT